MNDASNLIQKVDSINAVSAPIIQDALAQEILNEGNKLALALGKEDMDSVQVVKQISKIKAMLARYNIQVANEIASKKTDELNATVVVLVGTYQTRKAVWFIQATSTTIQVFAAVAGLGFMGGTMARGAAQLGGVGQALPAFKNLFEESQQSQRTLMEFLQSELRRGRDKEDTTKGGSMQEHRESVELSKQTTDSHSAAIRSAGG